MCARAGSGGGGGGDAQNPTPAFGNGYSLVAQSLARLGVKLMYGVIGIPVSWFCCLCGRALF